MSLPTGVDADYLIVIDKGFNEDVSHELRNVNGDLVVIKFGDIESDRDGNSSFHIRLESNLPVLSATIFAEYLVSGPANFNHWWSHFEAKRACRTKGETSTLLHDTRRRCKSDVFGVLHCLSFL